MELITYNSAADDKIQVIYYTSTGDFALKSNQFIGINSFNEDDVLEYVNDGESKYYTGIYISGIHHSHFNRKLLQILQLQ